MSKFLISFPAEAMASLSPEELEGASVDSHAVVREAKEAGVWVFGGGIDGSVAPVAVDSDGNAVPDGLKQEIDGGYAVLELPTHEAALEWAARIAAACRCPQEVRKFGDDPES